jgi:hypothetical protein
VASTIKATPQPPPLSIHYTSLRIIFKKKESAASSIFPWRRCTTNPNFGTLDDLQYNTYGAAGGHFLFSSTSFLGPKR